MHKPTFCAKCPVLVARNIVNFNAFGWVACVAGGIRERASGGSRHPAREFASGEAPLAFTTKALAREIPPATQAIGWALLTFHFEILDKK